MTATKRKPAEGNGPSAEPMTIESAALLTGEDRERRAKAMWQRTKRIWPASMMRPLSKVVRYENNPRLNDAAVADVLLSLLAFGAQQPIVVDEASVIVVGDTRYLAAQELGWPSFPVHVAVGLSEAEAKAYRIADNKTGERAEWDHARLHTEFSVLRELGVDLSLTGFRPHEWEPIMASEWEPTSPGGELGGERGTGNNPLADEREHPVARFEPDQWERVLRAVDALREERGTPTTSIAECLTLICVRFMEGR